MSGRETAAGIYELTPVKQRFRGRRRERTAGDLGFGGACVGSSIGLMCLVLAVGMMSIPCMCAVAALAVEQKLLPARARRRTRRWRW